MSTIILADEFQDSSRARIRLLKALTKSSPVQTHLCVVGDDWQGINRFAGSDISVMSEFEKVFDHVEAARRALGTELATGELNRLLEDAVARHSPPVLAGRRWKLLYATQVSSKPPTFMLFANRALPREHAYRRYLENRLRETLALRGVPVRLVIRRRST